MKTLIRKIAKIIFAACKRMKFRDVSWIVPNRYFNKFSTMQFYGMEVKVPAKKEEYLAYRYGEDWQIPRRDWITEEEDGAVASTEGHRSVKI